ncbi:MAG: hypothetical protein IKW14_00160 [Phascolarctobacterium sp.]|nr:hypothetical protein [Phascolarctobacterium sp.]
MKMFKKIFVLASCATMLLAGSAVANANNVENKNLPVTKAYQAQAVEEVLFTTGKIVEVNENMIVVKGEHNLIAAMITDETYLLNGKNGKAKKLSSFKVGKEVTVYHSPKMTRSIPAQTVSYAIVLGNNDEKQGKYFKVDKVTLSEDGSYVSVIDTNHNLIATIDKKACKDFTSIESGDELIVWYNMMTMSLPARTNAQKALIL